MAAAYRNTPERNSWRVRLRAKTARTNAVHAAKRAAIAWNAVRLEIVTAQPKKTSATS
jgi:hypothetical protein